jgi:NAD(P)-dependent dehydrogenase (short-subunit alcohol dehydrogenase family)
LCRAKGASGRPSSFRPGRQVGRYEGLAGQRIGEIADVVEAVLYLERAPFVTGETLHVDGGQAAGH